ncbi:MAG: hypothetical protein II124_00560 [Clostridia bacterium]|nr:hypothetical protein [Clostridia bacterium]
MPEKRLKAAKVLSLISLAGGGLLIGVLALSWAFFFRGGAAFSALFDVCVVLWLFALPAVYAASAVGLVLSAVTLRIEPRAKKPLIICIAVCACLAAGFVAYFLLSASIV